jgi:hypothetical protein
LTIFTSCKSFREKYTLNESHLPDYLCPTILYAKQHLGSGGTGSVFATSDPDDRLFVVKISQGAQRHLLLHESNIYRALALLDFKSTFIPRYFGFFSHPDFDVIVMEHTGSAVQHISHLSLSDRSAHLSLHPLFVASAGCSHIYQPYYSEALLCSPRQGFRVRGPSSQQHHTR